MQVKFSNPCVQPVAQLQQYNRVARPTDSGFIVDELRARGMSALFTRSNAIRVEIDPVVAINVAHNVKVGTKDSKEG